MEIKENTHIVIKREDALNYLDESEYQILEELQYKIMRGRARNHKEPSNNYYVCNTDEPYAEMVKDVIISGEYTKSALHQPKTSAECNSQKVVNSTNIITE